METTITSIEQTTDYRTFLALAAATRFYHLGLGRAIVRILYLLPSSIEVIVAEGVHLAVSDVRMMMMTTVALAGARTGHSNAR